MLKNKQEVEEIFREIREQVKYERRQISTQLSSQSDSKSKISSDKNSQNKDHRKSLKPDDLLRSEAANALTRLQLNLSITENTRNNLPPIASRRRCGITSRFELWIKRQIKRATRWFTWDQLNFNSAVHQSLGELHAVILSHELMMTALQQQIDSLHNVTLQIISQAKENQDLPNSRKDFQIEDLSVAELPHEAVKRIQSQMNQKIEQLRKEFHEQIENILNEPQIVYQQPILPMNKSAITSNSTLLNSERTTFELENK